MKTEEDEAFDDLARRQGAWGGGFNAKRQAAMDKINSHFDAAYKKMHEDRAMYGTSWSKDGERIDPMSVYFEEPAQEPVDIAKFVEGMEVSIDVSTGDHDSTNRLFGTVTLVQQNQGSKHGLILLVQDPAPNFKPAAQPAQEPVANSFEEYCKTLHPLWNTHISHTYAEQFFNAGQTAQPVQEPVEEWPGQSNIESQHNACQHRGYCKQLKAQPPLPVQEPVAWVGLTDEQRLTALKFIDPQTARLPPGLKQFAESIEQLLKEKNNGL